MFTRSVANLDVDGHLLVVAIVNLFDWCHGIEHEIAVVPAVPSPVDMVAVAAATIENKLMAFSTLPAVDDGAASLQFG